MPEVNNKVAERFNVFADVLSKIYAGIGPIQRESLRAAVTNAYADKINDFPTIYDVEEYYRNTHPTPDAVTSILSDFNALEVFDRHPVPGATFDTFFRGVTVIPLHSLGQNDKVKQMVAITISHMYLEYMLRLEKKPYVGTNPQRRFIDSFIVIDEAENIMRHKVSTLSQILLQGREFGVGAILSSQFLSQFKQGREDYRQPLLTWLIHKVPSIGALELREIGFTADAAALASRVASLPNHYVLFKSAVGVGRVIRGKPFFELIPHEQQQL